MPVPTGVPRGPFMIDTATTLASTSGEALNEIVELVDATAQQVQSIATAAEEQSSTSEEINRSIEDVNRISLETSSAMRSHGQFSSGKSVQRCGPAIAAYRLNARCCRQRSRQRQPRNDSAQ